MTIKALKCCWYFKICHCIFYAQYMYEIIDA